MYCQNTSSYFTTTAVTLKTMQLSVCYVMTSGHTSLPKHVWPIIISSWLGKMPGTIYIEEYTVTRCIIAGHASICTCVSLQTFIRVQWQWGCKGTFHVMAMSQNTMLVLTTPWPSQPSAARATDMDRMHDEDVWPHSIPKVL